MVDGEKDMAVKLNIDIKDRIVKEVIKRSQKHTKYYIDITNEFCNIFGDVVKQVKIELDIFYDYQYDDEDELNEELKKKEKNVYKLAEKMFHYLEICLEDDEINLYGMNTYITFLNGETLRLWNTEGIIEKV